MSSTSTLEILIQARDEASGALKSVEGSTTSLTSKLAMLGGALVAAGAAYISLNTVKGIIDDTEAYGAEVRKVSVLTGESTEQASQFLFAVQHVGIESDAAATMLGRFSKNMFGIQVANEDGTAPAKTTAAALADIGITALDASGNIRPMNDLLYDTADAFQKMPDGIEKTAIAQTLFGKSGKDMIPLLNLGSDGMKELATQADKLGLTLSADNVAKIKQYTLSQRDMGEAIKGLKLVIGLELMPVLTRLTEWFVSVQPQIREGMINLIAQAKEKWAELQPELKKFVEYVQTEVIPTVEKIVAWFKEHWPEIQAVVHGVMLFIQAEIIDKLKIIGDVIKIAMDLIHGNWSGAWQAIQQLLHDTLQQIMDEINARLEIFKALFGGAWEAIKSAAATAWGDLLNTLTGALDGIKGAITDGLNTIVSFFTALPGNIVSALGNLYLMFWNIGKDIINGMISGIEDMAGGLLQRARDLAGQIGSILNPKNWFGSPQGLQNWLPYYFEQGLKNLQATVALTPTLKMPQLATAIAGGAQAAISSRAQGGIVINIDHVDASGVDEAKAAASTLGYTVQQQMRARGLV